MKKLLCIIMSLVIVLVLAGCGKAEVQTNTTENNTTANTTMTQRIEKTTAKPKADKEKGEKLTAILKEYFSEIDGYTLEGDIDKGSFTYKYTREPEDMYRFERSESIEENARRDAQALADEIGTLYPDKLTLESFTAQQIGSGDNGIDSVIYIAVYVNTQNQVLEIRVDSDGIMSYANCTFTW